MDKESLFVRNRLSPSGYYKDIWITKVWFWPTHPGLPDIQLPDIEHEIKMFEEKCFKEIGLDSVSIQEEVIKKLLSANGYKTVIFPSSLNEASLFKNNVIAGSTKGSNFYNELLKAGYIKSSKKDNEIFYIDHKGTPLYFSYYLYASSNDWKHIISQLRKIDLITQKWDKKNVSVK